MYSDYVRLYGVQGAGDGNTLSVDTGQPAGAFHPKQFVNLDTLPFDASVHMNSDFSAPRADRARQGPIGLRKRATLSVPYLGKVHRRSGLRAAFSLRLRQPHTDRTAENSSDKTVNFVIYISDVTDPLGAMHYVRRADSERILGARAITAAADKQVALQAEGRSAAAPAGSVVAYCIDTLSPGHQHGRTQGAALHHDREFQACRQCQHWLPCLAVCRGPALASCDRPRHPRTTSLLGYSAAGRSVLDPPHAAAVPIALAELGHDELPRGAHRRWLVQRPEPAARAHALLLEVCCTVSLDHSSLFGAPRAIDTTAAIYRRARLDLIRPSHHMGIGRSFNKLFGAV